MANTATLAVKIVSDSSAARADIGKSSDAVGKWGDRASKVGRAAGRVLAVGIAGAAAAAVKFTQAAAEDAASAQKLADALKQATGATDDQVASVEKWIEAQGKALGVADDELRPALSRLATVTEDVGKAQKLAALAMDISARTGKPLKTVVEGLAKAQTGSITGLAKFGVQVKDNAGETKSLNAVMKDLSNTYAGAAAKSADTAAGRQKRLSVAMDELQEKIGAKLLPVMEKLIDVGFKVIAWIDKNQKLVGILAVAIGGLLAVVYVITTAIKVWTAVQAAFNVVMALNPIGLVVIAVIALVAAIVIAYKKSETFRKIVDGAFRAIWNTSKAVFEWIKSHWELLFVILTGPVGLAVVTIVKSWGKIRDGAAAVVGWIKDNWKALASILGGPIVAAAQAIGQQWDKIKGAAGALKGAVISAFKAMVGPIMSVVGWVGNLIDKIQTALNMLPGLKGDNAGSTWREGLDAAVSVPTPRVAATVSPRVAETVNVTVQGSIIGTTDQRVGDEILTAINRSRAAVGKPPIGS